MKIQIDIPAKRIADLMCCVIEGNHMTRSWCNGIYCKSKEGVPPVSKSGDPWYAQPDTYDGDFTIAVHEVLDESLEPEGNNIKIHVCNQARFVLGFALMASDKYGKHFGDFLQENEDIYTADLFIQLVAFGEEKYA